MKKCCYFIILILLNSNLFGLNNINKINQKQFDKDGNEIAYHVFLKGKKMKDGSFAPAKYFSIPILPKSEYLPNIIQIKTKSEISLIERKSKLPKVLANSIDGLEISDIQAPYERFAQPQLQQFNTEGISRIYEVKFESVLDVYEICKELMNNPEIEYAVPVFMRYINDFTPNDPRLANEWHIPIIQAAKAWEISQGDSSIIIGITDSGVDYNHEDLLNNIWQNLAEDANNNGTVLVWDSNIKKYILDPEDINGIDDDDNGYIDDMLGWDFVGNTTTPGNWREDNDPKNGHWHGTHVSGCAAAVSNNGKGVAAPGFKCKILPIKCGLDNTNSRGIYRGYDAILYAAQMGAKIINCSWGGPGGSPVEQELINTVYNMGSVIVVSAGNSYKNIDYGNSYPAGYDNVLCVGATRSNDKKAGFSNYGHLVTVYAPGENILSTMPNNSYSNQSGTSMSSPVLAGICGQVLALHPDWTPRQIMHQIRSTSDNVVETDVIKRPLYYGRANAYRALSVNNSNISGYEKLPGISVSGIAGNAQVLTDFNNAKFKVIVTNYLERAYRVKVKIKPFQNYLSVSKDLINIGTMNSMQSDTFELDVKLLPSTPWFEGKVDILIEYNSDAFVDYQLIQIPIHLSTNNKFTLNSIYPEENLPIWYSGVCTDKNNMMLVGASMNTGNGIFYKNGQSYNTNGITQYPIYTIHAIDASTYYAGTGGALTQIIKTNNSGVNWEAVNVTNITNFINYIYFYDALSGVFIGDPIGTTWGVAITKNGGQTWSKITSVPAPLSGESAFANCAHGSGANLWFGTNKGRIIYSQNRADSWAVSTVKQNGFIHSIYFLDNTIGFCLYGDSQWDTKIKVATTVNGGSSWNIGQFDFSTIGVTPFYLYSPKDSKIVITLCKGGEVYYTSDNGKNWKPILTQKYSTVSFGAAYCEFGEGRIWGGETELWNLDFEYIPNNPKKTLSITPASPVDYAVVEVGKTKTNTFTFENKGNMKITIDSIVIKPKEINLEKEFEIIFMLQPELSATQSKTMRIKFAPKTDGLREADMIVYSNADEKVKTIKLKGTGTGSRKELSFIKDTVVIFDTTQLGSLSTYSIKYKNTGNQAVKINEIFLSDKEEFSLIADTLSILQPNQISGISMTFTPKTSGLKTTLLKINSEAGSNEIALKGVAIEPISVDDINNNLIISEVYPNPILNAINFTINSGENFDAEIGIFDNDGNAIAKYRRNINTGENIIEFETKNIPCGNYYLKVNYNKNFIIRKFIKLK